MTRFDCVLVAGQMRAALQAVGCRAPAELGRALASTRRCSRCWSISPSIRAATATGGCVWLATLVGAVHRR